MDEKKTILKQDKSPKRTAKWSLRCTIITMGLLGLIAVPIIWSLWYWWSYFWTWLTTRWTWLPKPNADLSMTSLFTISLATVGGVGGLVALVVAYRKQATNERQQAMNKHGEVDKKLTDAVHLLGEDSPSTCISCVYALMNVGDGNPDRRQQIIDILCGYLRTKRKGDGPTESTIIDALKSRLNAKSWTENQDFELDLHSATITENLVLSDIEIRKLSFEDATFDGTARFESATFNHNVLFGSATFNGASFANVACLNIALFKNATFNHYITFNKAVFNHGFFDHATLCRATFDGASFNTATFNYAKFDLAIFACVRFGNVQFEGTEFRGSAFDHSRFDTVTFNNATLDHTTFEKAEFNDATFRHAIFGNVLFDNAEFNHDASFDYAIFNAITSADVIRKKANFYANATFIGATFNGDAHDAA